MKTKLIGAALALGLATMPLASFAGVSGGNANSSWTVYAWQNWSYEFVEVDGYRSNNPSDGVNSLGSNTRTRDIQRISNNAANIGFAASIDSGMSMADEPIKVNFQCEQFTFINRFNGSGFAGFNDFCNRNSKIGLAGVWGEVMFANWLLPFNEMVAAWIDPFYDAGADSHTSIMGSVGYGTRFFNGGFGFDNGSGFGNASVNGGFGSENNSFNRRQNGIVQWMSPNWGGFTARFAYTNATNEPSFQFFDGNNDVQVLDGSGQSEELDPTIMSMGIAYETDLNNGDNVWLAATYEDHNEWAAVDFGCDDSNANSWRIAGRYIHDWGGGWSTQIGAMYEDLEYEQEDCAGGDGIFGAQPAAGLAPTSPFAAFGAGNKIETERNAWMISGKQNFPGPIDFRFTYMDADDMDCDTTAAAGASFNGVCGNGLSDGKTDADAFNLGLFYTMPAGTELRVTYSEVDNGDNAAYDFGISPAGATPGADLEMWAVGIVQWF